MGKIKGWKRDLDSKFEVIYKNEDDIVSGEKEGAIYLPLLSSLSLRFDYDGMWFTSIEADISNFNPDDFSIHDQRFRTKQEGLDTMIEWMRRTAPIVDKPR